MSREVFPLHWHGVLPAITTEFDSAGAIDHGFAAAHCRRLVAAGCAGVVVLGSLGESAALDAEEKAALLATCVAAVGDRAPVVAGISALTTASAVGLARRAASLGCAGLMILPPYVYGGDEREMEAHVGSVLAATPLPAMLYNNPVAYGTDFLPARIAALASRHENLRAVKESSTDVRRVTAIRALCGDRLSVLIGVDDALLEAVAAGAVGWVAGVANALPRECVALFQAALAGERGVAESLYRWLLPLLRMDTVPKFVQLIKLMQAETGTGSARVRPPRLELEGAELQAARAVIQDALRRHPELAARSA